MLNAVAGRSSARPAIRVALISLVLACLWQPVGAVQPPSAPEYEITMKEATIVMPDGVRLAVDLHMPTGGEAGARFPVLLEYLPYRKAESRAGSHALYSYFVQRGYVVARVDIRGTGNSEGRLIPYEYSEQRAPTTVKRSSPGLRQQPWSNGNVGMFGISWGGFNAIQMASRNPPALKAIIAVDATDDLYQDDVHYMDGIMHLDSWEMSMDLDNARPGAPDYVIDDAYFRDRFDTEPWMLTYKKPAARRTVLGSRLGPGPLRRRSRCRVSTSVAGTTAIATVIPRMLEHVKAPVKAMIGPWSHAWPHEPYPKPGMEWRHEAVRWFDHWLKGRDTGIMRRTALRRVRARLASARSVPRRRRRATGAGRTAGRSRASNSARSVPQRQPHSCERSLCGRTHQLRYVPTVGIEAGGPVMWWGDVAHDQRPTDAFSLVYDTEPLSEQT